MNEEQQKMFDAIIDEVKKLIPEIPKTVPSSEDLGKIAEKVTEGLKEIEVKFGKDIEELKENKEINEKLTSLNDIIKTQGLEITKLKDNTGGTTELAKDYMGDGVKDLIKAFINSEAYKEFAENGFKGMTPKFALTKAGKLIDTDKASVDEIAGKTVSISSDHTGEIFITDPRLNIRETPIRQSHIRDLMPITSTQGTQITAPEVYEFTDALTGGMQMLGENGEAQDIGFKTKENTWTISRIAASLPLSKRYPKVNGLAWVINYLSQRLPNYVRNKEDFQLLFGDGSGENVDGLTKDAQVLDLDRATYTAGAIASVATWNGGTQIKVTFTNAHNMRNGDTWINQGATETTYNATFKSVIVEDAKNIIVDVAYVAEADTSAWNGSSASPWKNAVTVPNIYDVVVVAANELRTGEYMASGVVLSPVDYDKMGLLKASDNQYVGVTRDAYGRININGLTIVDSTAMPAGKFLVGDFQMAVELAEFTPLTIRAVEDTTDAKKNQVTWIIEEEFIFPKYNPYWFIYGNIEAAITALTAS